MRNNLAYKNKGDAATATKAGASVDAWQGPAAGSPVHSLQERLWNEFDSEREQAVFDSFSAKQAVAPSRIRWMMTPALILSGAVGGWALFYAGSVAGLY
ncbi:MULTISPECIES: hypothetical protein [unclassified Sphingomonas]|uniref:hypothetical protein n=1 Tax=unclassified Sphingomonas TaxID=196159 RepID=UPI00277D4644|nr:hypothetical protein [Sphingomonas sp. SORGH_AS_0879]MDQ1230690.1 hypothetical protein [Sphingomonas sp. SORGH_AS_0879]